MNKCLFTLVHPLSPEENKVKVRRFIEEVVNKGNLTTVDELFHSEYVLHIQSSAEPIRGAEPVKRTSAMFRSAFPDWHDTIEDVIASGDRVVTRWTESGTHKGEFQGIAPTGRQVRLTGIDIFRLKDGKIVEQWVQMDMIGMMQQLGVAPSDKSHT